MNLREFYVLRFSRIAPGFLLLVTVDLADDHYYGYLACFDLLALGCIVGILEWRFTLRDRSARVGRSLQVLGVAVLCVTYLSTLVSVDYVKGPTLIGSGAAIFIAGSAMRGSSSWRPRATSYLTRFMSDLGALSYEIYLFHMVVLSLLVASYRVFFAPTPLAAVATSHDAGFVVFMCSARRDARFVKHCCGRSQSRTS